MLQIASWTHQQGEIYGLADAGILQTDTDTHVMR
jgi:hypothetical protein